jgi:hypothetical protein
VNRSQSRQPNASSTQPSLAVAAFYAIVSAMALAAAGTSAWFIVSRLDVLAKFMAIDKAYYVLLVLLGLGVAAFLFGAMRSYGSIRGKRFGAAFEFGGPAVIGSKSQVRTPLEILRGMYKIMCTPSLK